MSNLKGEIRMIKWGVIPGINNSFTISVGQHVGGKMNLRCTQIIKEFIEETGLYEYHVECVQLIDRPIGYKLAPGEKDFKGEPFVWKTYNLAPDEVQYFVPDEKHDYVRI